MTTAITPDGSLVDPTGRVIHDTQKDGGKFPRIRKALKRRADHERKQSPSIRVGTHPLPQDYGQDSQSTRPSSTAHAPPRPEESSFQPPKPPPPVEKGEDKDWSMSAPDPKAPYGYERSRSGGRKPADKPSDYWNPEGKDSAFENLAESAPFLGTVLSINDIHRAAKTKKHGSLGEKLTAVGSEIAGAVPGGKLFTRGLGMAANTTKELAARHGSTAVNLADTARDLYGDNVKPAFKKLMSTWGNN